MSHKDLFSDVFGIPKTQEKRLTTLDLVEIEVKRLQNQLVDIHAMLIRVLEPSATQGEMQLAVEDAIELLHRILLTPPK